MFTNNYINFRHNMFFGITGPGTNFNGIYGRSLVSPWGGTHNFYTSSSTSHDWDIGRFLATPVCNAIPTAMGANTTAAGAGVYFGTGTTPATRNDITLESPITSGLTVTKDGIAITANESGQYCVIGTYSVTNTGADDVNIWEIGCFAGIRTANSNGYTAILMDRTVLDAPITIKAGETKTVNYGFEFNQS
jgi:hypothetical protein